MIELLSALMRRFPLLNRRRLTNIMAVLPKMGFSPIAHRQIGPMRIGFDVRDQFQREMLLDKYEPTTEKLLRTFLRPGDTYVDIGTQLGYTAAIAADQIGHKGRMVLIEPDPTAIAKLEHHLSTADPHRMPRVDLVKAGCSDDDGVLRFHLSPILGHSRILKEGESPTTGSIVSVPVRTADSILKDLGVEQIHFLKIDTEGHEVRVLRGLQQFLKRRGVDAVHIEKNQYLFDDPERDTQMLHALIAENGYRGIHEERMIWITDESLQSTEIALENFFFLKDVNLFSKLPLPPQPSSPCSKTISQFARIALHELESEEAARAIIRGVRNGEVQKGLRAAEELLQTSPDLDWLRGHLAWWYTGIGEREDALRHYRTLFVHQPENEFVREKIRELGS
ncbi:MAG: FkbM family methyltransferase [Candidatus Sumerlaeia bacterium]|nr:FkbM family methyltransferase [Candidatus Sumerlaeia bacterium]